MAIFSLHHSSVGRSTQTYVGTSGAHARYVLRPDAARAMLGEHMPTDRAGAQAWLDQQEQNSRKNERVIDKIRLALPRELDEQQRAELVRDYAQAITQGRAAWVAGIHDQGKDAHNPHAHLIVRDRDHKTGKRVAELSSKGSTEQLRELWETIGNKHLEQAERAHRVAIGSYGRLDRRTLEAQGIERAPQIHIGPRAQAMEQRGIRPESQERQQAQPCRQGIAQNDNHRTILYPAIDQGKTRAEHNAAIIDLNRERERQQAEKARQTEAEKAKQEAETRQGQGSPRIGAVPAGP